MKTKKKPKPYAEYPTMIAAMLHAPVIKAEVPQGIIDTSTPDNTGNCLGARALRMLLAYYGIWSIRVTPDTVRFNMTFKVAGKIVQMRCNYDSPAPLARAAHLFDHFAHEHDIETARKRTKPFSFILQRGNMAPVEFVCAAKLKKRRKKSTHRKSAHPVYRRCPRRYHPLQAYTENGRNVAA